MGLRSDWRRCVIAAGLGLVLAAATGPAPAYADPHEDKARVDAALVKTHATLEGLTAQAQQAAVALDQATKQLAVAQAALADATGRVAAARADARQAARAARAAANRADAARAASAAAQAQLDQATDHLTAFVQAAYKGSRLGALNALISATSPSAVTADLAVLDILAGQQQAAVDEAATQRVRAKEAQNTAEAAAAEAKAARLKAQHALDAATAAEEVAQQATDQVAQVAAQKQAALAAVNAQKAAVLKEYAELKAESERIAAELRKASQPPTAPKVQSGARLLMPVVGWKSSDFGWRYDPYYHVWQLHAGVDLAAAGGSPIYAAAAGTVAKAGWYGGYGNYTCILHGTYHDKSLATCYGHQSKILVRVGQHVSRGQLIGRVGTTGASTGYHLHFEVRLDGEPVQPLTWLPSCLC
jgi:murein DD-endopeptidase MepM/ murein hydrolase activator NlpD